MHPQPCRKPRPGGSVIREPGSVITGQINEYGSSWSNTVPWLPSAGAASMARENAKMMTLLAYSVIVVLVFLIFPVRVRTALDRVEHHPGLSAAVGALALVAAVPIAVLLFISFIGWPLLPLEVVAYIAGVLIGQAALDFAPVVGPILGPIQTAGPQGGEINRILCSGRQPAWTPPCLAPISCGAGWRQTHHA